MEQINKFLQKNKLKFETVSAAMVHFLLLQGYVDLGIQYDIPHDAILKEMRELLEQYPELWPLVDELAEKELAMTA